MLARYVPRREYKFVVVSDEQFRFRGAATWRMQNRAAKNVSTGIRDAVVERVDSVERMNTRRQLSEARRTERRGVQRELRPILLLRMFLVISE